MSAQNRRTQQRRIRTNILLALFGLAIVPVVVLTAIGLGRDLARESTVAIEQLQTVAAVEEQTIDEWIEDSSQSIRQSALDPLLRATLFQLLQQRGEQEPIDLFETSAQTDFSTYAGQVILDTAQRFDRIIVVNAEGYVVGAPTPDLIGRDFSAEPWFRAALEIQETGDVTLNGPLADPIDQRSSLYYTTPIIDDVSGEVLGVLSGRVRTVRLNDVLRELPTLGETGEVFLVGDGQQYVTRPRLNPDATTATGDIIPLALSGEEGVDRSWTDYRGEQVIGVYTYIEELDMALIVKQDRAEALQIQQSTLLVNGLIGLAIGVVAVAVGFFVSSRITGPLESLTDRVTSLSFGEGGAKIPDYDIAEVDQLANAFNRMSSRVQNLVRTQERTIRDRTHQLEITAQMGRVIAAETDLARLLNITVDMIRERLGYYHAQVFLIDDLRQNAVLRASTGEAGRELLKRGHKLEVGSTSVIGRVTESGDVALARDADASPVHKRNELLPDTRAELAVPLRIGDQILGALDIQSTQPDAFDEGTISVLQTVADQLAVAIRNAQLFQEKEGLLSASLQLTQMLTRDNWGNYAEERDQGPVGFRYNLSDVEPLTTDELDSGNGHGGFEMPIQLRGEVIGQLQAQLGDVGGISDEERDLVEQVLERMALALDNARLFEQTQVSLSETARLYDASQTISESDNIQSLATKLLTLCSAVPPVQRATLYVRDDPEASASDQTVLRVGMWDQTTGTEVLEHPDQLIMNRPPLAGIIDVPFNGEVYDTPAEVPEPMASPDTLSMAIYPLVAGRRVLAWLMLENLDRQEAFREQDQRFFQTVSDQAATALESIRLFEQTQARARRLQAVNEVTRATTSILNMDILLPLIVEQISEAFDYYHVQIFLTDEMGEWANLQASTGEVGQEMLDRDWRLGVGTDSVIGQVTAQGVPIIAADTEDADVVHRPNPLLPDTRAEMAIPLKTGDRVIGALDVQATSTNAFDEEAQIILQSLADQLSVTLENAQLFQEIQDRVAELTTINLVSQAVSRAETLDDLYDVVGSQMMRTFGAQYGYLALLDGDMIELPIFIEKGDVVESPPPSELGEGITSIVIKNKQPLLITENAEERAREMGARVVGSLPKSLLIVPLTLGEEVIGAVSIQADYENAYDDSHVRQMSTLAAYISVKIRNAELLLEAQERAQELGFLFNLTRVAVQTTDLEEALANVDDLLLAEVEGAEAASIYLDLGEGQLEPRASVGYLEGETDIVVAGDGMIGIIAEGTDAVIVENAPAEFDHLNGHNQTRSAIIVPLMTAGQRIGVISIESSQRRAFSSGARDVLEAASGTLTAVIQSARLLEEVAEANEELKQLDKLKSEFLANMSHELRTPLNSIIGFSKVILNGIDGPLTDMQEQDLTTIHESGKHLLGLINDILDMSKIESGKMEIHPEYVELPDIVKGVMSTAIALVKDKPIDLYQEVGSNVDEIYADPKRLRQILLNLISNAAKFTHEGSITVRATILPPNYETGEPQRAQIEVQDTGIGIDEKGQSVLFERFRQVDGSTTRQVGGTGLGLPITKEFIELMGGTIWVESDPGEGSNFIFTVPTDPPTEEGFVVSTGYAEGRPVILAIDDEPRVLDLYQRYLDKSGYAMVGLTNAEEMLEYVVEHDPAAVILDIAMPNKDGWQCIEELKSYEETYNIPIVVCTIHEEQERAFEMGVNEYLTKPIIEEDLLAALEKVVAAAPVPAAAGTGQLRREEIATETVYSVLLIDSHKDYAQDLHDRLEATGSLDVAMAHAGYEGLGALDKGKIDVVIFDVDIPDMDGYGLVVSMRSHPTTKEVPIVILTDREMSDEELTNLDDGLTYYMKKSDYEIETLADGLAEAIGDMLSEEVEE